MALTVLYTANGTQALYDIVRAGLPSDVELLTLQNRDSAEYLSKLARCDVVILATRLQREAIQAAPRLRLVLHQGVGYQDTVDLAEMRNRNIRLAITPDGTITGVAEHAIMLMLAVYKHLIFADAELRKGNFHVQALRPQSRQLKGRVIGYVGMGSIAQAVAERLRAFGTRGLYADPNSLGDARERELGLERADLDTVLKKADVLTVHVPLTAGTRGLIGADAMARMQPGSILINTARGGVVDETALHAALVSGHLAGAGLDVFEVEPVRTDNPLCALQNVIMTPHISAGSADALREKMVAISENLARFRAEQPLCNEITLTP